MAVLTPSCTVSIDGVDHAFLEVHTAHSVDAGIAQCSLTLPSPPTASIKDDVPVVVQARRTAGDTLRTIFSGRMRGPINRQLLESEATVSLKADGNLWRFNLPVKQDMAWDGPITPRKLIKQFFAFYGIEDAHVEQFVDPSNGVPLLLGGVPWFDGGLVICPAGTSPFAFVDRICRLFGYRVYDRPDGRVRVMRICGPPPEADHTLVEGVDILNVGWDKDLHPMITFWIVQGASGTNLLGEAIGVESVPVRGVRSQWIPNPPDDVAQSLSDSLLVSQQLATACRQAHELDYGGKSFTVSAEVIGTTQHLEVLNPKQGMAITAPSVELDAGKRFWQISVSHDFTADGYWTGVTGWRPRGSTAREGPHDEDPPLDDDEDRDPLPPTWDEGDPDDPDDPIGDPPTPGPVFTCPPVPTAPARACQALTLQEPGWETDVGVGGDLILPFTLATDADACTVNGEIFDGSGTVAIWQDGMLLGSTPVTGGAPGVWSPFSVLVSAAIVGGIEAEVRITV